MAAVTACTPESRARKSLQSISIAPSCFWTEIVTWLKRMNVRRSVLAPARLGLVRALPVRTEPQTHAAEDQGPSNRGGYE